MGSYLGYIMAYRFLDGLSAGLRASYGGRRCCCHDDYYYSQPRGYSYYSLSSRYSDYSPYSRYSDYSPYLSYSDDYYYNGRSYYNYSRPRYNYDCFEYSGSYYDGYQTSSYSPGYYSSSYGGGYYTYDYPGTYDRYSKYSSKGSSSVPQQTTHRNGTSRPPAGQRLGKEFLEAVKGVAQRINCDYGDLLAVMNGESGLNPAAVNSRSGATGLIQFMPSTARNLGTTTEALRSMSAIEQLSYVEELLKRCKRAAGFGENERLTGGDLYALIFLPARAKREVLCEAGEGNNYYEHNSGTDLNKDGKITKSELQQRVENKRVDESIFQ